MEEPDKSEPQPVGLKLSKNNVTITVNAKTKTDFSCYTEKNRYYTWSKPKGKEILPKEINQRV